MRIKKTLPSGRRPAGFSLLELLLVMALVPFLFFAVYSNFSTGVRLWTKVMRLTPEEDVNILTYKVRRDLEHILRFSPIPFTGDEQQVIFASAIRAKEDLGGDRAIGEVRLYYDRGARALVRSERDISEFYREAPGRASVLLTGVTSCEFSYLTKEPLQSGYQWQEFWKPAPDKVPVAVKMTYAVDNSAAVQERIVFIPVGGEVKT